ncbi:unnamed protein product [Echinostoma caproni]|uniref:AN1-type domain-containing protein n=1 Tax=Echinostoma caproni TaxID=27848 RepID=A0A3P8IUM0_9TREM|nr:unnamed protein product [Echinostoma caproni]
MIVGVRTPLSTSHCTSLVWKPGLSDPFPHFTLFPHSGFTCRCGGLYCGLHRYSDAHSCSFDYRESGQEEIRRSNPQIICQKVQKI